MGGPRNLSLEERYWAKVIKQNSSRCWGWRAAKNRKGYGIFSYRDPETGVYHKGLMAHRIGWMLVYGGGYPPRNQRIMHTCEKPWCQNPKHWKVLHLNPDYKKVRKTKELTPLSVAMIRKSLETGHRESQIREHCKQYGLTRAQFDMLIGRVR